MIPVVSHSAMIRLGWYLFLTFVCEDDSHVICSIQYWLLSKRNTASKGSQILRMN